MDGDCSGPAFRTEKVSLHIQAFDETSLLSASHHLFVVFSQVGQVVRFGHKVTCLLFGRRHGTADQMSIPKALD